MKSAPFAGGALALVAALLGIPEAAPPPAARPAVTLPATDPGCPGHESERKAFIHGGAKGHVRSDWYEPANKDDQELWRDCQGCHGYPEMRRYEDPQPRCVACHYGGSMAVAADDPRYLTGLVRPENGAFYHYDHRAPVMACRDCHLPTLDGGRPAVGAEPVVETGKGSCIDCHDPVSAPERWKKQVQAVVRGYCAKLNDSPSMKENDPRARFLHDRHLPPGKAADPQACVPCHRTVADARADDLGNHEVDVNACRECHRTQDGSGVRFDIAKAGFTSRTDGTFPHDKHLSAKARETDRSLDQGCIRCHVPAEVNGLPSYGLKPFTGPDHYQTCLECHFHKKQEITDHGTIDGCMNCHDLSGRDMKTNRPVATVARPRPVRYEVRAQAHPLITGGGPDAACKDCHRAKVPELPSRIGTKVFSHDTHLPADPKPADCLECHVRVGTTSGPASPAVDFYAPESACRKCHLGDGLRTVPAAAMERTVPVFPHDKHLGESARAKDARIRDLGCVACHVPAQNGEPGVGTTPEAAACTLCHDHGERKEITGGKDRGYVSQCQSCHHRGVPDRGFEQKDARVVVQGTLSPQYHPDSKACRECHAVVPPPEFRQRGPATYRVFGEFSAESPHATLGYPADKGCTACHWADAFIHQQERAHATGRQPGVTPPTKPLTFPQLRALGADEKNPDGYPGGRK